MATSGTRKQPADTATRRPAANSRAAASKRAASSKRDKRRDLRARSKRRRRGADGVGPMWVQRGAQHSLVGIHRVRARIGQIFAGDRPFLLGFLGLLVLGVLVISGPMNAYLDQQVQLDLLTQQVGVLDTANAGLSERAFQLREDEAVELLAREEYGLVRPGEVAYVVVPPDRDGEQIIDPVEVTSVPEPSRLQHFWDLLTNWFG